MEIADWNERYRSGSRAAEDLHAAPTPLLVEMAKRLADDRPRAAAQPALRALDLACGTGRNALWLAQHGWNVTAVDAAPSAVTILRERAAHSGLAAGVATGVSLEARVADLARGEFHILPAAWDLVAICYYLQRSLFEPAKQGVVPGGILISIVHITEPHAKLEEESHLHRLRPGELENYFQGWEIIHRYEGKPHDAAHQRAVAEIVARRPAG